MASYVLVLAIALFFCVLGGIGVILRQRYVERERLARYTRQAGGQPKSIVCPKCSRRSYSESAIRNRYCPSCKSYHDSPSAPAKAGAAEMDA